MKKQLFFSVMICYSLLALSQAEPNLPNTSTIDACFPDTTGYKVITVGPSGRDYSDLQLAINDAQPGSVLVLDGGVVFNGSFLLPDKTGNGWIIITSSKMNLLPALGTRVAPKNATGDLTYPQQQDAMPKIITTNSYGIPCFYTEASSHHYRLMGLEISIDTTVTNSYGLVVLGDASSAQNSLSAVPHDFIIDRCYIHGHTKATIMKVGVILNCANSAVINSYISDFHSIGYDAQAIGGTNGPGPFQIINNYLEASGENILFGGAAASIPNLVPSDIEVRNNYFFKPYTWRVGDPNYAGIHWEVKNLFELKTGKRVLLDANILENSWADLPIGQSGYAILLTIRTEGGGSPQADISDITITNNIIRHVGAGITLSGHDDGGVGIQSKRIKIANNLFDDINGPLYGDQNIYGPNDGVLIKIGDPTDLIIDHNTVFQTGAITWAGDTMNNFVFTNNMTNCFMSAGNYQGIYGPGFAHDGNTVMGADFPDITDANQHFNRNVLIGGDASKYTDYATVSQNYFPAAAADVNFVNYSSGITDYHNYALSGSSPYKNSASDGSDIGVDFSKLDLAMAQGISCLLTSLNPISDKRNDFTFYPNPANDKIYLRGNDQISLINYSIYNSIGEELLNGNFVGSSSIDLSTFAKGIYTIAFRSAEKKEIKKLVLAGN